MDELQKLEYLSLVSKVCTELENHLGMNDKDLAEFIIHLSEKNGTFESFKKALIENGAEFSDSFISNLLRIIQHMKPKKNKSKVEADVYQKETLATKFPGLALPNEKQKPLFIDEEAPAEKNEDDDIVADLMKQFEADAPSNSQIQTTTKSGSASPIERKRSSRSRSRSKPRKRRKSRSRDRDSRKDKRRSRSRDQKKNRRDRSGSRSKRNKERSRSRNRRSRSRDRRSRSRDRRNRSKDRKYKNYSRDKDRRERSNSRDIKRDRSTEKKFKSEKDNPEFEDDPTPGKIYNGKVSNIVPFGCFVQLEGLKRRWEGLVHISQLRAEGRVTNVSEVTSRGARVKVSDLTCLTYTY
uniref:ATP-dependent RNA helicase DHX8-like n=1 Tax=Diabrotica virgifera virgifera TaxID=50390 RepID=A0A6P7GVK9_DIAVI